MAKIRHVAICAENTGQLAEFYKRTFGMHEVRRRPGPAESVPIILSDGYINLAVLPASQNGGREGIFHFGFHVEDLPATNQRAQAAGAAAEAEAQPQDGRYVEFRLRDPVGTPVDLSERGWET
jgi:catechol 2,3-dioxygenase-like lactoylglutathione lyase family enzyme